MRATEEIAASVDRAVRAGVPATAFREMANRYGATADAAKAERQRLPRWRLIRRGQLAEKERIYNWAAIYSSIGAIEARNAR